MRMLHRAPVRLRDVARGHCGADERLYGAVLVALVARHNGGSVRRVALDLSMKPRRLQLAVEKVLRLRALQNKPGAGRAPGPVTRWPRARRRIGRG